MHGIEIKLLYTKFEIDVEQYTSRIKPEWQFEERALERNLALNQLLHLSAPRSVMIKYTSGDYTKIK